MSKIFLPLALLLFCSRSFGESIIFVGGLKEDINQSGVAEIGIKENYNDNLYLSGSLMWFSHEDNIYDGFNVSVNMDVGTDVKAYSGVGVFGGQYKACEYNSETNEEECEYSYTGGLYPEIGIQVSFYKIRIAAYSRYYKTFDAGNNEYKMYGLYSGYEL